MSVAIVADREADHATVVPIGVFDLEHVTAVVHAVDSTELNLTGCRSVDVDLAQIERIDGTGAVLLARLLDRLDTDGCRVDIVEGHNPEAARLIVLYRTRRAVQPAQQTRTIGLLTRIGTFAAGLPDKSRGRLISQVAAPSRFRKPPPPPALSIGVRCQG